jgi:hypothetical protein
VWGAAPSSVGKNSYYVSFIDDFSKFTWIFLLKHKSKVFAKFMLINIVWVPFESYSPNVS